MEIELKFRLERGAAGTVVAALARLPGAGMPDVQRLDAAYFDTRDDDLRRAGLTLRVRRENGVYVQTVKGAGGLAREEWNDPAASATPDAGAGKSGRRLRRVLRKVKNGALHERFRVKVTRTTIAFLAGGAVIEAAVDVGFIQAGRGARARLPVCELELELKSGAPALLHDFALRVADRLHLRLEGQSKSGRGYALAKGDAPAAVRSRMAPVRPADTLATVLRDAGRVFLGQFAANMTAAEEGWAEGVHQMRVALRRLRGILKAMEDLLPPGDYAWVNQRLKHVLLELGPARNWDVLLETLKTAPDLAHRRTAGHRRLIAAAEAARGAAYERVRAHMRSPRVTKAILETGRWFESLAEVGSRGTPDLTLSAAAAAPQVLARAFRRLCKKARHFARLDAADRHALRIAAKNLRYATELFAPLYGAGKVRTFLRRLKAAQEVLGELNDLQGAHALLGSLVKQAGAEGALGQAAGEVLGWRDRTSAGVLKSAARTVGRVRDSRPFW